MNLGKGIYSILNNDSPVNTAASGGIFPNQIPQGKVPPFLAYRIDSVEPFETKDGVSTVDHFDITVACFAKTYNECDDLAAKIRTALDGYQGTANGIVIDSIVFEDVIDIYDDAAQLQGKELEFMVRVKN